MAPGPITSWQIDGETVETVADFSFLGPLWWPQGRPVPMRVARGPLRIPLPLMPGPKSLCGLEVEVCSRLGRGAGSLKELMNPVMLLMFVFPSQRPVGSHTYPSKPLEMGE